MKRRFFPILWMLLISLQSVGVPARGDGGKIGIGGAGEVQVSLFFSRARATLVILRSGIASHQIIRTTFSDANRIERLLNAVPPLLSVFVDQDGLYLYQKDLAKPCIYPKDYDRCHPISREEYLESLRDPARQSFVREVDAIKDTLQFKVWINGKTWPILSPEAQVLLVFHELIAFTGKDDSDYRFSSELGDYLAKLRNQD